jgi:hypothetical protein
VAELDSIQRPSIEYDKIAACLRTSTFFGRTIAIGRRPRRENEHTVLFRAWGTGGDDQGSCAVPDNHRRSTVDFVEGHAC